MRGEDRPDSAIPPQHDANVTTPSDLIRFAPVVKINQRVGPGLSHELRFAQNVRKSVQLKCHFGMPSQQVAQPFIWKVDEPSYEIAESAHYDSVASLLFRYVYRITE